MVAVPPHKLSGPPDRPLLTKRLIWEQSEPLLDVVQQGGRTVVLSNDSVALIDAEKRSDVAIDIPRIRDPRGRLGVDGNALVAYFPGATCRGTEEPLHVDCDASSAEFSLNGENVHFTQGRNTLAGMSRGDETARVCQGMTLTAIKENVIGLVAPGGAARDQTELPGPITALWPSNDGGTAVIRNPETEQYAAYAISVDCGSR